MLEFTVAGSPAGLASAIEAYALAQGNVNALVVPWESDGRTLSMAVTSVRSDGWAIEHVNLGTITLTALAEDRTRVAIAAGEPHHPEPQKLAAFFAQFARQVQDRFTAGQ